MYSIRSDESDAGDLLARRDLSFLRMYTANPTKHRNTKPPITPPTIAPVLLCEDAGLPDSLVSGDGLPAELGEDVEDGDDIDSLDPEDGAADVWARGAVGEAQR